MTLVEERLELEVERIAAGGDGVAHAEGMVVFVPRTAAGDTVRARITRHKRFARGQLEEVLAASRDRVQPPCGHYTKDDCGGCQLQHIGYPTQVRAKSAIVSDAISRIGKRGLVAVDVTPSERQWRYRQKLTLAFRRRGKDWVVGLHPYHDPVRVFQLDDCPITIERVVAVWREVMAAHEYFPDADELRAAIQISGDDCVMVMEGGNGWSKRAEFFRAVPSVAALWWKRPHDRRQLVATRAEHDVTAAASFAQVNREIAEKLRAYVVDRVTALDPKTVVDGYSGTGDTAAALAAQGMAVTAIELDRDASAHCAKRISPPSKALAGRVEDLLPSALPADLVLLNPPRTGVDARVTQLLQETPVAPRAVLYVSCDPATLGRDLARMPRYAVASVRSFDMFPQTAHVETVCELRFAA